MTTVTGTLDISSLKAARFQSAAEFGLDKISAVIQADVAAHNDIVSSMLADMCELTSDRQRLYGTSADGEMVEVDEYGRGPTQRPLTGATVGFPLKAFQYALGWTEKWFKTHTPSEMADQVLAAEQAHLRAITRELKKAIFLSSNYTYRDHLVDNVDLAIKRFVNADSQNIPNGPNGESFDGATHTHYVGEASLTADFLTAIINDVIEHGHGGAVKIAINKTNEAAVRQLTGFVAYPDPRIIYRATDTPGQTLDISRLDNRAIGIFGGAEVWVKSWAIANYVYCWDAASPNKPLAFRQRASQSMQGLQVAAENSSYPLVAKFMEAEYGIGVWTRTNGAVLYFANATYADPTIT